MRAGFLFFAPDTPCNPTKTRMSLWALEGARGPQHF